MREFLIRWLQGTGLLLLFITICLIAPSVISNLTLMSILGSILTLIAIPAIIGKVFFFWIK